MDLELKSQITEPLAALAFPATCQICCERRAEPVNGYVCGQCLRDVRPIKPPWCNQCGLPFDGGFTETSICLNCHETEWYFDYARSLFTARGLVRDVIHRFKYNHAHYFQPLIDIWLKSASRFPDTSHDLVIPVPLHPFKEREREFNQAEHMANIISSLWKTPLNTNAVERIKYTEAQTHLSRAKRMRNMQGAFAIKRNCKIQGVMLLVDDVMTTGATVNACAHVLKQAGASTVNVITLARAFPV